MIGKAMFLFILFVTLMTEWSEAGLPPTTLKGIGQSTKTTTFNFEVNGSQATKTATGTLIDNCGMPSNLLANCSGEHSTAGSGWSSSVTSTAVATYGSASTTTKEFGNSQITWSCAGGASGGTCLFYQDVTTSKSVQGLTYLYASTTNAAATKYVSRINGATKNTIQFQVTAESQYKSPEALGSSSTGLGILVTVPASTAYTGTIDWAAVGAVDLKSDGARIANQVITHFSAASTMLDNTAGESRFTLANLTSTGDSLLSIVDDSANTRTKFVALKAVTVTASYGGAIQTVGNVVQFYKNGNLFHYGNHNSTVNYLSVGTASINLAIGDYLTVGQSGGLTLAVNAPLTIAATESGSSTTYSSTNADTDWASCGHTSSSFNGLGTVTGIETMCKRQGGDLLMRGKFITGATLTAVEPRIPFPVWNGSQLVAKGTSAIPSIQYAGDLIGSGFSSSYFRSALMVEPAVGYMVFGAQQSTTGATTKITNASTGIGTSQTMSFFARIPIEGWDNSNIIIGQFNGLESCADSYQCTDTYSAKVSATGVVSDENIDWINGNCTGPVASPFTCTFKTGIFTVAPNCVMIQDLTGQGGGGASSTATTVVLRTQNSNTGTATALASTVICQKQGVDYIGKTAKAVASDQNVRSVGSVGVDIQSAYFGSSADCSTVCSTGNCTICTQVGSKITSISWQASGQYRVNGVDGIKYNCFGSAVAIGTTVQPILHDKTISTSAYAAIYTGTTANNNSGKSTVTCIGIP